MRMLGGPGSGNFGHEGRPGLVGGSGEGVGAAKQVATNLHAQFRRERGGYGYVEVEDPEPTPEGGMSFAVRNWGDWEVPPDEEDDGDYDWKQPTAATRAKLNAMAEKMSTKDVKVTWFNQGEKNWIAIIANPRTSLKSMGFRYLGSLRTAGAARKVTWNGRDHYVVPVVALCEGVIHAVNAKDAEFVPFKTFSQNVNQWNGRPLMLGHPVRDGIHIAASDPTVLESGCFGSIFNTRIENQRLLMDAYVDPDRLIALGREDVLTRVINGQPIEISVGAQVATDTKPGEHNGRAYKSSWMALSADHLAFLPDGRGACSIDMGCGAHRAMADYEDDMEPTLIERITDAVMSVLGGKGSGHFGHSGREGHVGGSDPGDGSSGDKGSERVVEHVSGGKTPPGTVVRIAPKWRDSPSEADIHYTVVEDNGDRLIIRAVEPISKGGRLHGQETVKAEMIERVDEKEDLSPKYDKDGKRLPESMDIYQKRLYEFSRTRGEVQEELAREPAPAAKYDKDGKRLPESREDYQKRLYEFSRGEKKKPRKLAEHKDCPMCQGSGSKDGNPCDVCEGSGELKVAEANGGDTDMGKKALIDKIVACSCSGYDKNDVTALEGFSELRLTVLADMTDARAKEKEAEDEAKRKTQAKTDAEDAAKKKEADEKRTLEQKITALETELRTAESKQLTEEEFNKRAPDSIRAIVADKRAADAVEVAALVTSLKAASSAFTEDELKAKPLVELRKLAAFAKIDAPVADYSGRGLPLVRAAADATDYNPPNPYEAGIKALQAKH